MSGQPLIGALFISIAVVVQATTFEYLTRFLLWLVPSWLKRSRTYAPRAIIVLAVLCIFALHTVQVWVWTFGYLALGEFNDLAAALYFSTVTFTTLGYGDITLSEHWRLLSAFEAVNGILMLGWSTAYIYRLMTYVWQRDAARWESYMVEEQSEEEK
jgi:voltage-gated potassium channel Kch